MNEDECGVWTGCTTQKPESTMRDNSCRWLDLTCDANADVPSTTSETATVKFKVSQSQSAAL